jgi:hypothetical protein
MTIRVTVGVVVGFVRERPEDRIEAEGKEN